MTVALQLTLKCCITLIRYFTKMELKELFSLGDPTTSSTQQQLQDMHASERETDTKLDEHIAYLHSLGQYTTSTHFISFI